MYNFIYRGEYFRDIYLRVGEMCSLVSSSVKVLASTATISQENVFLQRILGMKSLQVYLVSSNKY